MKTRRLSLSIFSLLAFTFLGLSQGYQNTYANNIPTKIIELTKNQVISYQVIANNLYGMYTLTENNQIKEEGRFIANKPHSTWKEYYANGNVKAEVNYVKGTPHGKWTVYYENGTVMYKYQYSRGKPVGSWKHFSNNGELLAEINK